MKTKNYIIMSVYNRLELTKKTIDQLFSFSGDKFNFWVVDDGSSSDTKEYLNNLKPYGFCESIELTCYDNSIGKAKRLNQFLNNRDYDFCSIVDNDVLLPPNWVKDGIKILKKYHQVGIVSVNVEGYYGPVQFRPIEGIKEFLLAPVIGAACFLFSDFVKNNIKNLCEDYGRYGHEDAHIASQVWKKGKLVVCLPSFGIHLGLGPEFFNDEWTKNYFSWKKENFDKNLNLINNFTDK